MNSKSKSPARSGELREHDIRALQLAGLMLLALAVGVGCHSLPAPIVRWSPGASLTTARKFHTATKLNDGRVLVTGGLGASVYLDSAEIFDPATGIWTAAAKMSAVRAIHTATLLRDGRVLVVGGLSLPSVPVSGWRSDAELFDPATGTWASAGSMTVGRASHTASILGNGDVVIAGGLNGSGLQASVEIYHPNSNLGVWTTNAPMAIPRSRHAAVTLADGITVLVAGGIVAASQVTNSAEQYSSVGGQWTPAGALRSPRLNLTLTLLAVPGKVLAAGGENSAGKFSGEADLYQWGAYGTPGTWSAVPDIGSSHSQHTATLLPSLQQVVIAGGLPEVGGVDSSRFDIASSSWTYDGGMSSRRLGHTATLLNDGRVLVVGGFDNTIANGPPLASAEIFTP